MRPRPSLDEPAKDWTDINTLTKTRESLGVKVPHNLTEQIYLDQTFNVGNRFVEHPADETSDRPPCGPGPDRTWQFTVHHQQAASTGHFLPAALQPFSRLGSRRGVVFELTRATLHLFRAGRRCLELHTALQPFPLATASHDAVGPEGQNVPAFERDRFNSNAWYFCLTRPSEYSPSTASST